MVPRSSGFRSAFRYPEGAALEPFDFGIPWADQLLGVLVASRSAHLLWPVAVTRYRACSGNLRSHNPTLDADVPLYRASPYPVRP